MVLLHKNGQKWLYWFAKATFVSTTSMLKKAAPVRLILRKAALGAALLQIRSFAASFRREKKRKTADTRVGRGAQER